MTQSAIYTDTAKVEGELIKYADANRGKNPNFENTCNVVDGFIGLARLCNAKNIFPSALAYLNIAHNFLETEDKLNSTNLLAFTKGLISPAKRLGSAAAHPMQTAENIKLAADKMSVFIGKVLTKYKTDPLDLYIAGIETGIDTSKALYQHLSQMSQEALFEHFGEIIGENLFFAGASKVVLSSIEMAQKVRCVQNIVNGLKAESRLLGENALLAKSCAEGYKLGMVGKKHGQQAMQDLVNVLHEVERSEQTVWNSIKMTDRMYEGTRIPKSFELTAGKQKLWVAPNVTKHMREYIERNPFHGMPMNSQSLLQSFKSAVDKAIDKGIVYDTKIFVDRWEFVFGLPRSDGLLPVVFHAVYKP